MLQRIISIKNVGRFRSTTASGDVTFRPTTLIFGENGRGKTTLCAILRSLSTGSTDLVSGRATLGSNAAPEIRLLLRNGPATYRNSAWTTATFPDFAIFDGTYVSQNVFAGDVVGTDHRRNLYRVIVGAQGVVLANSINEFDDKIRAKNNEIRDNRTQLQRHMAPGMTVATFVALPQDATVTNRITATEQELQAAQRATQIQQRAGLLPVSVPAFPPEFAEVIGRTIEDVGRGAEQHVTDHIARHHMAGRGEEWLSEGLPFIADDACPFCGREDVGSVELVRTLRNYFSRAYHQLRDDVRGVGQRIDNALAERVVAGIKHVLVQNTGAAEFWAQYCNLTPASLPEAAAVDTIVSTLRRSAHDLISNKAAAPLGAVAPDESFTRASTTFEALRTSLAIYNAAVAAANATIEARRRDTQAANVREVETRLARLTAQRVRYSAEAQVQCARETRFEKEKRALEKQKAADRQQLDTHTAQVITTYGQSINRYLERINAGFRITTPAHTYRGGKPSTSYQIVINNNAVDLGDAATPLAIPSFKNTLSAGDRTTLALAFFLAQLEQDANRDSKVVVFDDPFSSQDSFRRNHTVHQIQRCAQTCAQVVLLSHEPSFLKLLWDRTQPADRKTLQLARVGEENTAIIEWNIERAVQARYRADIDALQRFLSLGEAEPRDVIQKLRPVLEGYCKYLYPTLFGDQDTLGVIVGAIRTAADPHPLQALTDGLDEINMYCRRYHHAENPDAATEPIGDTELQGYVRRTLTVVGCLP